MEEQNSQVCSSCGKAIEPGSFVCMYCGHAVKKMNTTFNMAQMEQNEKKSSVTMGRSIAFLALFINVITVALSAMDFALGYVCLLTGLICGAIALVLVIASFTVSSKASQEEVDSRVGAITKAAIGVLIFSGIDFFVAINSALFWF